MYKSHPLFNPPANSNAKIWRYMDFTKYLYILEKKSLFFPRSDKFEDKFEGSYPQYNIQMRPQVYKDEVPEEVLNTISAITNRIRKFTFISCWHMSEYESAAMWKLYARSVETVAIQTTYEAFKESFNNANEDIYIGVVNYIDYSKQWMPEGSSFYPFLHKRISFEHEKELRAVIQDVPIINNKFDFSTPIHESGMNVTIDIDTLLENVYVSPLAPAWFYDLVKAISKRYGITNKVKHSILLKDPVY